MCMYCVYVCARISAHTQLFKPLALLSSLTGQESMSVGVAGQSSKCTVAPAGLLISITSVPFSVFIFLRTTWSRFAASHKGSRSVCSKHAVKQCVLGLHNCTFWYFWIWLPKCLFSVHDITRFAHERDDIWILLDEQLCYCAKFIDS